MTIALPGTSVQVDIVQVGPVLPRVLPASINARKEPPTITVMVPVLVWPVVLIEFVMGVPVVVAVVDIIRIVIADMMALISAVLPAAPVRAFV